MNLITAGSFYNVAREPNGCAQMSFKKSAYEITEIVDVSEVELLLANSSLPLADIRSNDRVQLFGIYQNANLIGCIGTEIFDETALLRSLAVVSRYKRQGIGTRLVEFLEDFCRQNGVREIYLLTESAERYFARLGYLVSDRRNAPSSIKTTTQFSSLCPTSSTLMHKELGG